jgi:hypothetical protein
MGLLYIYLTGKPQNYASKSTYSTWDIAVHVPYNYKIPVTLFTTYKGYFRVNNCKILS